MHLTSIANTIGNNAMHLHSQFAVKGVENSTQLLVFPARRSPARNLHVGHTGN